MTFDLTSTFPTLSRAPITEAIIDIQIECASGISLGDLAGFGSAIESRFAERHERHRVQAQIEIPPKTGKIVMPSGEPDGYVFVSQQEHLVVQARFDGFTLSRLRPYHDGETFLREAQDLWRRYVAVAHPSAVTRLAIRNINRIEMSAGSDIRRYVLTGPEIALGLPQRMFNFFLSVVVPDADSGAMVVINETLAPQDTDLSVVPLILDIEAFRETSVPPESDEIWDVLRQLRVLKNRIFFRSLTVETLESYR